MDLISTLGCNGGYVASLLDEPIDIDLEANGVGDYVAFEGEMMQWLNDYGREKLMEKTYVDVYMKGFLAGHMQESARMLHVMRENFLKYVTVNKTQLLAKVVAVYPTERKMYKMKCSLTLNQIFHGK